MGYIVAYRQSVAYPVQYHYEPERHLAGFTAQAVILEGFELLGIETGPGSYPLTRDEVLPRETAKAAYRKDWGENRYADEEAFVVERFRAANRS